MLDLIGIGTNAAADQRLSAGEGMIDSFTTPPHRKDFHLLMAETWSRLGRQREPVLKHLLAADEIGIAHPQTRADVYCAIGSNAARLGQRELALRYYERYLAEFKRDARRHSIAMEVERLRPSE